MITLRSRAYLAKKIKPTKAKFWKDVRDGDDLYFSLDLKGTRGASSGGLYALYIEVFNGRNLKTVFASQNELIQRLKNFELTEV